MPHTWWEARTSAVVVRNGTYTAVLTEIKQFQNAYGDRIGFEFTIQGGAEDGLKVMRSTSPNLSSKSKLASLLHGLLGRELKEHEMANGFDVEALIGTECTVLVMQSKRKAGQPYSNVEQVFRN